MIKRERYSGGCLGGDYGSDRERYSGWYEDVKSPEYDSVQDSFARRQEDLRKRRDDWQRDVNNYQGQLSVMLSEQLEDRVKKLEDKLK